MSRFLDPKYEHLETYTPGEQPQMERLIKLNTNECPYAPSQRVLDAIAEEKAYNRYPDPFATAAVEAAADFYGLGHNQVVFGNGSDEILSFIFLAFGRKVYFPSISYGFYPVFADLYGSEAVAIPLKEDFTIDPADYFGLDGTILIANPNAPTGLALSLAQIVEILDNNKDQLVVVDEAYVDFGAESAFPLIDRYDNLLVVQTLSKSRALAGLRVGFAMGNPALIEDLNRIRFCVNPYNLSREAVAAAAEAIYDIPDFIDKVSRIKATRDDFQEKLGAMGIEYLPSQTNFVFAKTGAAAYDALRERGILVRHFDEDPIRDWVRISIGTPEDMSTLLAALEEIL